jgi:hypothetical protein
MERASVASRHHRQTVRKDLATQRRRKYFQLNLAVNLTQAVQAASIAIGEEDATSSVLSVLLASLYDPCTAVSSIRVFQPNRKYRLAPCKSKTISLTKKHKRHDARNLLRDASRYPNASPCQTTSFPVLQSV